MSLLRTGGVVVGLLLLVIFGGVALVSFIQNPSLSQEGQIGGTIVLVAVAALGIYLVRRSSPEFFTRVSGGVLASPVQFWRWLIQPSTRKSPSGIAVWTLVVGFVLLALPTGEVRGLIALVLFLIYMVVSLIALVAQPGWWRRAILTLLWGPVVMSLLIFTAEAFRPKAVGEAALAFLGVLMWSWGLIPLTGLARLLFARTSPPPTDHPTPAA